VSWQAGPVTVRVPATSANLGPGFDALGLALTLYDLVEARITSGGLAIEVSGAGEEFAAAGEGHLVVRAMRAAFGALGGQPPGIGLRCVNAIPQGFGLGSSAAAIVAGLAAARALGPDGAAAAGHGLNDQELLGLATEMEGHPDNVAACLAGGLTIAWTTDAVPHVARLDPVLALNPVLCIPGVPVPTIHARQALPLSVPHADAAANSAHAALLVAALTADPALLLDATEDFLHQRYRAAAMPATADLVGRLRAVGVPAVVSGAGPAALALTAAGITPGADVVASVAAEAGAVWRVLPLTVDREGAVVM
jgi:homoserine kinase